MVPKMVKWLLLLAVALYAAMLYGGEDRGQLRAGLRPDALTAPSEPASDPVAAAPAAVARSAAVALVPMLPRPPKDPASPAPQATSVNEPAATPDETMGSALLTEDAAASDLQIVATETGTATLRWVAVDRANIRAEASKSAPVSARLGRGEAVAVLWTEPSGWSRVRIEGDGIDGFIHSSLLTDSEPQMP